MKKTILSVFAILVLNYSYSQEKEIKSTIKINAISIFKQVYDIQYEKVINNKNSVQFGIAFGNYKSDDREKADELHMDNFGRSFNAEDALITEKTFAVNVDYRYYYSKTSSAPRGMYLSPSIQYIRSQNSLSGTEHTFEGPKWTEYKQDFNLVNVRALIGCQITIADLININPYVGPSYAFGSAKAYNGGTDKSAQGIGFNYGLYVGVAL